MRARIATIAAGLAILAASVGMISSAQAGAASSTRAARTNAEAAALPALPTPGTAAQIAALVKSAPDIKIVPSDVTPPLSEAAGNGTGSYYTATENGCSGPAECVYGDTSSTKTIVLFGDSHADMWLPAFDPIGKALGYKIVLMYEGACPAASVLVFVQPGQGYAGQEGYYTTCDTWRTEAIADIKALDPTLVLLASKTFEDYSSPTKFFTAAQWKAGLKTTVDALESKTTKVGIIGDITYMPRILPECLAAYPTDVQKCGGPNPNTASHGNQAAEIAEAKALKIPYISTIQWICSKKCSPVIGTMIVDLNQTHINATYAEYLTGVMEAAVKKIL